MSDGIARFSWRCAHASHSLRPATGDSIMDLWRMTIYTVRDSKGNSSFGSVQL